MTLSKSFQLSVITREVLLPFQLFMSSHGLQWEHKK